MTPPVLGRLERVPNLRDYWANEASDFTPWLASETNIELLSETIGIDLEVQQQEAAVGPFRADILCRDALTVLDSFQRDSSEIERDLGFKIEWDRNVDRKRQGLHVRRDVDPTEQNRWPDLHMWTLDRLKAFDRVFRPRLLALCSTLIESEQPADSL